MKPGLKHFPENIVMIPGCIGSFVAERQAPERVPCIRIGCGASGTSARQAEYPSFLKVGGSGGQNIGRVKLQKYLD